MVRSPTFQAAALGLSHAYAGIDTSIDDFASALALAGEHLPARHLGRDIYIHGMDEVTMGASGRRLFTIQWHFQKPTNHASGVFTLLDIWRRCE